MSPVTVTPLVCPDCGGPLSGLAHDRVFFCLPCKAGMSPRGEDWDKWPLLAPDLPAPDRARRVWLPFWELKVQAAASPVNRAQEVAARLLPQYERVWVAGFSLVRASYFGDLGLAYTEKLLRLDPLPDFPPGLAAAGCVRQAGEARRYAQLFLTLVLDKRADVTGMDISLQVQGARLWTVPFADRGNQIQDPALGLTLPVFAVDDLEQLRRLS